jgi:hypothetical protein
MGCELLGLARRGTQVSGSAGPEQTQRTADRGPLRRQFDYFPLNA